MFARDRCYRVLLPGITLWLLLYVPYVAAFHSPDNLITQKMTLRYLDTIASRCWGSNRVTAAGP